MNLKIKHGFQLYKCVRHGVSHAGTKQPVHWYLEGKGLGIQQGTSVWVGSPKPCRPLPHKHSTIHEVLL